MSEERGRFAIDHIALAMPAGQEEAARRFYATTLGFVEVPKPLELAGRGGAWFRGGSVTVHLGVDPTFTPAKKAHPAFKCFDYAELLQRLECCGILVIPDPVPFEDKEHCYVADPFGNRIEFIAEPSAGA
jgi:catechol 2,3-dioxygenase-like lactoylglutathione lyase family enzyme